MIVYHDMEQFGQTNLKNVLNLHIMYLNEKSLVWFLRI